MANEVTRFQSPVLIGGAALAILSGLIGAMIAGSIHTTAIYTDRNQVSVIRQYFGTGAYQGYTDATCINTGGLAIYTGCSIQNGAFTGVYLDVGIDMNKFANNTEVTIVTSPNNTTTGAVVLKYKKTGSGFTVTGSGNNLPLIPPYWYTRAWFSKTPNGAGTTKNTQIKAQLWQLIREQYVP